MNLTRIGSRGSDWDASIELGRKSATSVTGLGTVGGVSASGVVEVLKA
jgi:hypothetical protein